MRPLLPFLRLLVFGNYSLSIIGAALTAETAAQLGLPALPGLFYAGLILGIVAFYGYAYQPLTRSLMPGNPRAVWYFRNRSWLRPQQPIAVLLAACCGLGLLYPYGERLSTQSFGFWSAALSMPAVAAAYYGLETRLLGPITLRSIGLLKPLVIGWVWAGAVTLYPVLFTRLAHPSFPLDARLLVWFLVKNVMFVAAIAVLFDIKDYADDSNHRLKTLVVRIGLRKTLFGVVLPLTLAGMAAALAFGIESRLPPVWIACNQLPFAALILLAYSLHRRRPILYYLVWIDGLLLLKAASGLLGKYLSA